jgi:hypothetical protein
MINTAYKSRTTKDRQDTNIPLSVQAWGRDGDKRRYFLVEGQNDTHFRVYRETDPKLKKVQWISVAGSIDEVRALAKKLEEVDGHKEAKALGERMLNAVPRFEASEIVCYASTMYSIYTNNNIAEAKATRVYPSAQGRLYAPRTRFLLIRRPHPWQAPAVYIRRRG